MSESTKSAIEGEKKHLPDLTKFTVDSDKKRSVAVSWPGGAVAIDSIAKSAFGDLVSAVAAHTDVRS